MKIGIVTYHRSHNYGALLQAIALRKTMADSGNEVYFIDYWPDYHIKMYSTFRLSYLRRKKGIQKKIDYILSYNHRKRRHDNFMKFISEYIQPFTAQKEEQFDLVIYGSDQIWRKQVSTGLYDPIYFGAKEICSKYKASYAASMGTIVNDKKDKAYLKHLISNLDNISVREEDLKVFIEELGFLKVRVDLDPTLLLPKEKWEGLLHIDNNSNKEYLLFYDLLPDSFNQCEVIRFAESLNLEIRTIYGYARKKEDTYNISNANPRDFVSLISGAKFIITSSYHGLVFSIIFHKQFFASFSSNEGRAKSLLKTLNIDDRLIAPMAKFPRSYNEIDYTSVNNLLDITRFDSLSYLKSITKS